MNIETCPSRALALLAAVDPGGAWLRCGLSNGHSGDHKFHLTWAGDPSREQCVSEHKGHRCTEEAIHAGMHVVRDQRGDVATWWIRGAAAAVGPVREHEDRKAHQSDE
jgi:hypothetical protein